MLSTIFILFIISVSLSVDPWKHTGVYEEIGDRKKSSRKKAPRRKRANNDVKLGRQVRRNPFRHGSYALKYSCSARR